jgi:membrane-associated phospholipid phosphatase
MPRRAEPLALALIAALVLGVAPAHGGGAADTLGQGSRPPRVRLTRGDAWFGLAAVAATGAAGFADLELRERALATHGAAARNLAGGVRALGAPEVLGPAVVLAWLAGRTLHRPALESASVRVGASLLVAGVATAGIKLTVGRVRPDSSGTVLDTYDPFSGHDSFPSGHAALSFAAATALDRETEARWVPWVAYPLAGLVAWSRVRDDRHWTSDVVAGAALGTWLAGKTGDAMRARAGRVARVGMGLEPGGESLRLVARMEF